MSATPLQTVKPNMLWQAISSGAVSRLCQFWRRSTDTQFICGLPGKEYEVWTNVSLRMTVLDAVRESRLSLSQPPESAPVHFARQIYRSLPGMVGRAIASADFDQVDVQQIAERAESEFASAGIESNHTLVVSSNLLFDGTALLDCVLGASITDANIAFLSEVHQREFERQMVAWTIQTPLGLSNISGARIIQTAELFDLTRLQLRRRA